MTVQWEHVSFAYGEEALFTDVNLELKGTPFIGVIGRNGSGKSTFLKLLTGLLTPTAGSISLFGHAPGAKSIRPRVGLAPQILGYPERLRVDEVLRFVSRHYAQGIEPERLIEEFGLASFRAKRCGQLSGGMQRRLALACAFCGRPGLVLLDEPTTGVDVSARRQLQQTLAAYQHKHPAMVLMVTHHPNEMAGLVDQFLLLSPGNAPRLIAPSILNDWSSLHSVTFCSTEPLQFEEVHEVVRSDGRYRILDRNPDQVIRTLTAQTPRFSDLAIRPLSMEEILERC